MSNVSKMQAKYDMYIDVRNKVTARFAKMSSTNSLADWRGVFFKVSADIERLGFCFGPSSTVKSKHEHEPLSRKALRLLYQERGVTGSQGDKEVLYLDVIDQYRGLLDQTLRVIKVYEQEADATRTEQV